MVNILSHSQSSKLGQASKRQSIVVVNDNQSYKIAQWFMPRLLALGRLLRKRELMKAD